MTQAATNNPSESTTATKPPYCSFTTFQNFIGMLHESHIPPRIDTSLMTNMSGGVQSQMMMALRFLGLIGPDGEVLPLLQKLVSAHSTKEWGSNLWDIALSYSGIVEGIDTTNGTAKELNDAFAANGNVDGSTRDKAVRFFLKLLDEAGVGYSSHFKRIRSGGSTGKRKRRNTSPNGNGVQPPPGKTDDSKTPDGMIEYLIPLRGKPDGKLIVPDVLNQKDIKVIEAVYQVMLLSAGPDNDEVNDE